MLDPEILPHSISRVSVSQSIVLAPLGRDRLKQSGACLLADHLVVMEFHVLHELGAGVCWDWAGCAHVVLLCVQLVKLCDDFSCIDFCCLNPGVHLVYVFLASLNVPSGDAHFFRDVADDMQVSALVLD